MHLDLRWVGIVAGVVAGTLIGVGVVTASNYSMPGDFLYPLKTASEQGQLMLTPSEVGKTEFHIVLAGRRMQEITEMSRRGNTDQVAELVPMVGQHLEEVKQVLVTTDEATVSEELKTKLEDSAARRLGELEGTLQEANEETKPVIAEALKASGESYGTAVEEAIANAPVTAVIGDMGTIQVIVTDPPSPEEIDSLVVQVTSIEAHLAAGQDSKWVTLLSEPTSFDMMELVGGKETNLGSQEVDAGTYTQVRMNIAEATVTVDGMEHDVLIPGGTLKFVRPFQVQGSETTVIILDFDGKGSIHVTGAEKYMLKPVVSLLISESHGELKDIPFPAPEPTPTPSTASESLPKPELSPEEITPTPVPEPTPISTPVPRAGLGTLEILATDPPEPYYTSIEVIIEGIKVHKVVAGESGEWIDVPLDVTTFDLVSLVGVTETLGTVETEAGKFTQIRIAVESITVNGEPATVPSGVIRIIRPFKVGEGLITTLELDFDGQNSVVTTGRGRYIFKPVIHLRTEVSSPTEIGKDTNPPEITITGVTEGQVVVSPDTVTPEFSATDDTDPDPTVVATLNGEVFISGTVVSEIGEYELVMTAIDASDNEAEEEINFEIVEAG
jgi:hypothetical protein